MELTASLIYYTGIALCIVFGAGGGSIGQGFAGGVAALETARQRAAQSPVMQSYLLGCAFIESGCVFSLIVSLVYLFGRDSEAASVAIVLGVAALSMGIVAGVVGMASGRIVAASISSMARQPYESSRLLSLMMVAQILLEAPMIFMFIIAFLVRNWAVPDMTMLKAVQLLGGASIFAAGTIGPVIGQSRFCAAVCQAVGLNMSIYSRIFSFSFIVQAMIETPVIFALLVSLMVMLLQPLPSATLPEVVALWLGVMGAIGFGSAGAAIGSGRAAGRAALCMARDAEQAASVARLAIFCQAIIDTAVIYSLIISVLIIKRCM